MRCLCVAMMAVVLTNCGHVPLSSLPKLTQLDIMTLDVEQLRVAVAMPEGLRVRKDSAIIITGIRETTDKPSLEERIILQEVSIDERNPTTANLPAGTQIFRIAAEDLARLETLRAIVRRRKQDDPDGTKGYLTVTSGACRLDPLPIGPLFVTTWLKTAKDETYFVVTRNVNLRTVIHARQLQMQIPDC